MLKGCYTHKLLNYFRKKTGEVKKQLIAAVHKLTILILLQEGFTLEY